MEYVYFRCIEIETFIYNIDNIDSMDNTKVKVQLSVELVNELIKLKNVGDTYTTVIWRLIGDTKSEEKDRVANQYHRS